MSYNFKSIADVDVVAKPSESANVLIEEDGVIKKASQALIGGGNETVIIAFPSQECFKVQAPENLYQKLQDMFINKKYINMVAYAISDDSGDYYRNLPMSSINRDGELFRGFFEKYHLVVYPDGLMDFFYDD